MDSLLPILMGIAILFIVKSIFTFPLRLLYKLIYNSIIGVIILYVLNFIGLFHIEITFWHSLIVGFLGIPGVILLLIF